MVQSNQNGAVEQINATPADFALLVESDPLIAERLKVIIYQRLLREKDAELTALKDDVPAPVEDGG